MIITICKDRECWKPLIAYDISDKYEISNYGNIRTIQNKTPIKSTICADGYKRVSLRNDNDIRNVYLVHRLVAFVFVDGYDASVGKVIVNHRDSDRANSYYENLEWVTHAENIRHGYDHGHIYKYHVPKPIIRKFNDAIVHTICGYLECGLTPTEIYSCISGYNFTQKEVTDFIHRLKTTHIKAYSHITQYYDIPKTHKQVNLSRDIVEKICQLLSESYTIEDIIKILEIPPMQVNKYRKNICDIKYHRTFLPISAKYIFPENIYYRKSLYPDDIIILICEHLEGGTPMPQITDIVVNKLKYNRTSVRDFIYDIRRRRIHTDISYMYKW